MTRTLALLCFLVSSIIPATGPLLSDLDLHVFLFLDVFSFLLCCLLTVLLFGGPTHRYGIIDILHVLDMIRRGWSLGSGLLAFGIDMPCVGFISVFSLSSLVQLNRECVPNIQNRARHAISYPFLTLFLILLDPCNTIHLARITIFLQHLNLNFIID